MLEFCKRNFMFDIRADTDSDGGSYLVGRPIVFEMKTDLGFYDEIIREVRWMMQIYLMCGFWSITIRA